MSEKIIEDFINDFHTGDTQLKLLDFVAFLRTNEILLERCQFGYWEDKFYWNAKLKDRYVCNILINDDGENSWVIWFDGGDSDWFTNYPLDEHLKEIAWRNADFCGGCGYCSGGKRKPIFGKYFDNVCRTPVCFKNPDDEELACMKKLLEIRKNDILDLAL